MMILITYYPEIEKNSNDGRSSWLLAGDFNQDGYDTIYGSLTEANERFHLPEILKKRF